MKKERERTLGIVHAHKKLDVVQQEVCVLRKSLQAQLIDAPARLLVLVDELLQLRCSCVCARACLCVEERVGVVVRVVVGLAV